MNAFARLTLRFEAAYALSRGIVTHTIRIQSAILARAESDFSRLVTHTIKALGADCFEGCSCFFIQSGNSTSP